MSRVEEIEGQVISIPRNWLHFVSGSPHSTPRHGTDSSRLMLSRASSMARRNKLLTITPPAGPRSFDHASPDFWVCYGTLPASVKETGRYGALVFALCSPIR